jgi:nucleotide-binding universal stress UspA family protein
VLCALDLSEGSEPVLVRAADLAERLHGQLLLLHTDPLFRASEAYSVDPTRPDGWLRQQTEGFINRALGSTEAVEVVGAEVLIRRGEFAADAILRTAAHEGADLIVVGTHRRRGLQHFLLGSVAEEVIRTAPCPVLTIPNDAVRTAPGPDAPVLVPIDFSDASRGALATAKDLAALFDAEVELIHVIEDASVVPGFYIETGGWAAQDVARLVEVAEEQLERFDREAGGAPSHARHVLRGRPSETIAERAEEIGAGALVMATHGLSGLRHLLLGSVTERAVRLSRCPVLSVHLDPIDPPSS